MDAVDEELAAVGAIFVEERMLRRIIKRHRHLPGSGLQVPHAHCYTLPRNELARLIETDEHGIDLTKLPEQVIVITGIREELVASDAAAMSRAWRLIFHARVHQAFDALFARGVLTDATVRERVNRVGQTEFDEVRFVLRQEDLLLPPADDTSTYVEFVALYLELRHFAPRALAQTFSTLHGAARVDATLALDVDGAALLAAARPARAPLEPVAETTTADAHAGRKRPAPLTGFAARFAKRSAEGARRQGNRARAAILASRAGEPEDARADIEELVAHLSRALGGAPSAGWADALLPVAEFAASQRVLRFTPGARLLHDLQTACVVAEREIKVVDAVTWALSRGKQPIVRPLPATREVRIARHVRAAAKKIATCEVGSGEERERLADAIHAIVARANQNVRDALRPKIEAALDEVQLRPRHLPERVAQKKIVDELLDHGVSVGRLSIGNLRDVIAYNDLKLPDLRASQLITGDQLLRADKILASSLDGVYRRGEIYMRFLQKVSSILSGNVLGRLLTLYVLLPVVGSFFIVEGLQHIVGPSMKLMGYVEPEIATRNAFFGVGAFLFLLLHSSWFRSLSGTAMRALGRGVRLVFWDIPRQLWRLPLVRPLCRWVLFPALPASLALWIVPGFLEWPIAIVVFAGVVVAINAAVVEEMVSDWLLRSGRHLAQRILPGLVKYSLDAFARLIEWLERAIYRVDELLRFRPSESKVMIGIKGVLGVVWFVITYFLRLYVNLFIEPTVNPIKHFPVVTVAAKLILPFLPQLTTAIADPASSVLGPTLGTSFAALSVIVLPGIAGFLAWELNGNWKLYRRTRPDLLKPISIGSHGESMVGFMKPGFHSGTIPKLHAKLRRAAWKGDERAIARHKEGLHHVEEAVWKFTDRQLVSMLNESLSFRAIDVAVHHVGIESNRLRIEIECPSVGARTAIIAFEQQSGWLLAGIPQAGWIAALDGEQRRIFEIALGGFYKLSGVDLVREQVEPILAQGGTVPAYDVADEGLVVWPGPGFETEIVYDLRSSNLAPTIRGAAFSGQAPVLAGKSALFGREPMKWRSWEKTWEHLAFGMEPKPLLVGPSLIAGPAPELAPPSAAMTAAAAVMPG